MNIRKIRTRVAFVSVCLSFTVFFCLRSLSQKPPVSSTPTHIAHFEGIRRYHPEVDCEDLPNAPHVLLLLKTGANEIESKLPAHLRTTLQCLPNYIIFSDVEQTFRGYRIHDALSHLPQYLNSDDTDLLHYRDLQAAFKNGSTSKMSREAGWKLDRFKFIPMLQSAYRARPESKWFVYIETDTALMISNLLSWLDHMDPDVPRYIGSSIAGAYGLWFAHGGSGIVVSRAAARLMAEASEEQIHKYFVWTKQDCCGDAVLAMAFRDLGVLIAGAYPHSNGDLPETQEDYTKVWCHAPVFMHHMRPNQIEMIHGYDRDNSADQVGAV